MTDAPIGAILAGGQATRMGRDKAGVIVGGESLLRRVAAALRPATSRVVVLGPDRPGWECWPDDAPGAGPLSGIATALSRMEEEQGLFVAVDHPFVRGATLRGLAAVASSLPVVPVDHDGVRQVTCARYPVGIADAAWEEAESGGSIQSLLDRVSFQPITAEVWEAWGEDGRSWFSVDNLADLAEGVRRFIDR